MATKTQIQITNHSDKFYYPNGLEKGLEHLIIFPDGEFKHPTIPNGSVWVYGIEGHSYNQIILGPDVGCGIAGFKLPLIDYPDAADIVAEHLRNTKVLGRGNHFVDLCTSIDALWEGNDTEHSIMLIHSDGKEGDTSKPSTFEEAAYNIKRGKKFRTELGEELAHILGISTYQFGDWTHNSVEEKGSNIIYRKGAVKTEAGKIHILPISLGKPILIYTVPEGFEPPFDTLPHGTGRKGPISEVKADIEKIKKLRQEVYVPKMIKDASLRSEHPDCYNDSQKVYEKLHKHMSAVGQIEIKAYIGKV